MVTEMPPSGPSRPLTSMKFILSAALSSLGVAAFAADTLTTRNPTPSAPAATVGTAFDAAKVEAEIEVYTDAQHGWTVPDSAVYHEAQAEKAWARMLDIFGKALA